MEYKQMKEIKVWDKERQEYINAPHIFLSSSGRIWENKRGGLEDEDNLVRTDRYEFHFE